MDTQNFSMVLLIATLLLTFLIHRDGHNSQSDRALEAAGAGGEIDEFQGETDLFIRPGYRFRHVDALLTNFHLPKSSLLMLVSALAGHERIMEAYRHAVRQNYRFFSYGDAMLILPGESRK